MPFPENSPATMRALTPLVVRFGAMGDMILLVPMLKVLRQRYAQACEVVGSGPWTAPLMARTPACGSVHLLTSRRAPYLFNRSQWKLVSTLRKRPPGPVYVFESDDKSHDLLQRAGIGSEWICSLRDLPRQPGEHIAAHAMRLARQTPRALTGEDISAAAEDPDSRLALTEDDRRDCASWLVRRGLTGAPLILVQSGNKKTMRHGSRQRESNVKYWPEANWAAVITGIRHILPAARFILCGAPSERTLAEDIAALVPSAADSVVVATDDLPIPRLLALQERAHSMVSVDTGPAHAAAAMGCPVVVLFTRNPLCEASLYAPLRTSADVRILLPPDPAPNAGLASISPDAVVLAWQELMAAR
jgi:heptosyltransferase-2/heptosyltransferase-3